MEAIRAASLIALLLASCAGGPVVGKLSEPIDGGPQQSQIDKAQFGEQPELAVARQRALENFSRVHTMKDPNPIFDWGNSLDKGWVRIGSEYRFGWLLAGSVNGRNSYGGYSGSMSFWSLFYDSKVIAGTKIYESRHGSYSNVGYYYDANGKMVVSDADAFSAGFAAGMRR